MSGTFPLSLVVQYASTASGLPTRDRFRRWVRRAQQRPLQMVLRLVDEEEGRALNRAYRGKDYATNVLTFVDEESDPRYGDVVICVPVVVCEAREQGKDLLAHYAHLTVHAVLHLQGYDHENERDAAEMEALETALLRKMGYPDPYAITQE